MTTEKDTNGGGKIAGALNDAENIIDGARKRAEEILAEAQKIRSHAQAEGYVAGQEEAKKEVAQVAIKLIEDKGKLNQLLSQEAAKHAIAICGTIIENEVKQSPEIIKDIALKALKDAVVGEQVTIFANGADVTALEAAQSELKKIANNAAVKIQSDEKLSRGSCKILTEFGEVDASVVAFLDAVKLRLGLA